MSKDIRVRYAPSPTGLLHIGNARTACLTICMHATMVELLSSVSKIRAANVMSKTENVPSLKTFVG